MKWTTRIIQGLLALSCLMFGFMKLSANPMQVEAFTVTYGYGLNAMYVVGTIELLAGIGLIIGFWKPRIAFYSAGTIVIIMAGAMLTHVRSGQGMSAAALPLIFLILALIVVLRRSKRA
ncbi:putative membrane protein YphA (DoxX/SURF4 family) [Paenibacillus sp. V4I9]|uniref:DoxX family protein n=1 Tax=Paenibacillus sp. V4I9 TaxID=3042308 RepID=UPI00278595AC|nr:DoxX family protein [Paenibacillus sp. V4I9]MDQ0891296.1 putative membrane protein YphA (DoxX/SURF4 family) [Paenibacillus sp. V4I9]